MVDSALSGDTSLRIDAMVSDGFYDLFSDYLLHIYRIILLLYLSSLFRHALGSWLRHVDHPSEPQRLPPLRSLYFLSLIGSLLSLFNLTCTLLSLRRV